MPARARRTGSIHNIHERCTKGALFRGILRRASGSSASTFLDFFAVALVVPAAPVFLAAGFFVVVALALDLDLVLSESLATGSDTCAVVKKVRARW